MYFRDFMEFSVSCLRSEIPQLFRVLSQMNAVCTLLPYFVSSVFYCSHIFDQVLEVASFFQTSVPISHVHFDSFLLCATCPSLVIIIDLIS